MEVKEFTSTELKRNTGQILNTAFNEGTVKITHRDRGELVILTMSQLGELIANAITMTTDKLNKESK